MTEVDHGQVRLPLDCLRLVRSRDDSLSIFDVTSGRTDIKNFGLHALKNRSPCVAVELGWLLRLFHISA